MAIVLVLGNEKSSAETPVKGAIFEDKFTVEHSDVLSTRYCLGPGLIYGRIF